MPVFLQVTKYVEREILNHRCLVHPHIVQFKEVSPLLHRLQQCWCWTGRGWLCLAAVQKGQ